MQKISIKTVSAQGVETVQTLVRSDGKPVRVIPTPGSKMYVEVDGLLQPVNSKAKSAASKDMQIKQVGKDLVLESEGEALVEVVDFYETSGATLNGASWSYVEGGISTQVTVSPESLALNAVGLSGTGAAESSSLVSSSTWLGGLAAGAVGLAAAASGGGGAAAVVVATNVISGVIVAGPVEGGLKVTIYSASGDPLGSALVGSGGAFSVNVGSYTGVVYAKVTDVNGDAANYKSEPSGASVDLGVTLLAVGNAASGSNTLNITPLTTIAARKAGVAVDGGLVGGVTLTAVEVNNANTGVAKANGLTIDITKEKPVTTLESGTNDYGRVLAAYEGAGANDPNKLETLVSETTVTGSGGSLSDAAAAAIIQGAAAVQQSQGRQLGAASLATGVSNLLNAAVATNSTSGIVIGTIAGDDVIDVTDSEPTVTFTVNKDPTNLAFAIDGTTITPASTAPSGSVWTISFNKGGLGAEGGHKLVVTEGSLSASRLYSVADITAPITGAIALATDAGISPSDGITNVRTVNVSGLEPGATWQYSTDGGTIWAAGAGTSFTLATGTYTAGAIKVRQIDTAGNVQTTSMGTITVDITVDTVEPAFNDGATKSVNFVENGSGTVHTATATDAVGVSSYAFDGGADDAKFNLNTTTGALTFKVAPDFETPGSAVSSNAYTVKVKALDAAGNATTQTITVNVTNVNEAPTAIALSAATIAENVTVGSGVEVGTLTVTDPDASGNNNLLSLSGTDASSFAIVDGKLMFTGTSPDFEAKPSYSVTVTSTDGSLVTSQAFTVNVTDEDDAGSIGAITGTPTLGQTLTAGTVTDPDGTVSAVTYQWKADGQDIGGATNSTYTLTQAEVGKAITVDATYTDSLASGKVVQSSQTTNVQQAYRYVYLRKETSVVTSLTLAEIEIYSQIGGVSKNIALTANNPSVSITANGGAGYGGVEALTSINNGANNEWGWTNGNNGTVTSATEHWLLVDLGAHYVLESVRLYRSNDTSIHWRSENITIWATNFTSVAGSANTVLNNRTTDTKKIINETSASSWTGGYAGSTGPYAINIDDAGSIAAINGTATQGQTLTAGTVTDPDGAVSAVTYQWKAGGIDISGATNSTYTLTQADVGKAITVVATYTDALGPNKTVTSAATSAVADIDDAGSIAAITGTATQGQTLTAGTVTDPDGTVSAVTYQWKAGGTDISGANSNTYTLTQADVGKAITVLATYTDPLGSGKTATSAATTSVAASASGPELMAMQSLDNVTNLDVRSALVLGFNQNIALGNGQIKIFDDSTTGWSHKNWATGETVVETTNNDIVITLTNGLATAVHINGIDSSVRFDLANSVLVNGSNLIIDLKQKLPSGPGASNSTVTGDARTNLTSSTTNIERTAFDWDFGSDYHVEFDAGIVSSSTNASLTNAALSDATTLNFKTVTPTASSSAATAAAASQIMDATGASTALSAGMSWISGSQGEITSAPRVIDMSQGSVAVVVDSNGGTSRSTGLSGNVQLNNFNIDDLLYLDNHGDMTLLTTNGLGAQNAAAWSGANPRTLTNTGTVGGSTWLTMFSDAGTTAVTTSLGDSGIEVANKFGTHTAKDLIIFG